DVLGNRRGGKRRQRQREDEDGGWPSIIAHRYTPSVRILYLLVALLLFLPLSARAFKEGPYPNVTGGFGEQSCHLCHLDNPLNEPGGSVEISGLPAAFKAGDVYPVTITLRREGLRRGGFEIAARFAAARQRGKQAGAWRVTDARAQLI